MPHPTPPDCSRSSLRLPWSPAVDDAPASTTAPSHAYAVEIAKTVQ